MYSEGNNSITSVKIFSKNVKVSYLGQKTSSKTPQVFPTSKGPPVQENSGYDAKAAKTCPGISISGTMVMWRSLA